MILNPARRERRCSCGLPLWHRLEPEDSPYRPCLTDDADPFSGSRATDSTPAETAHATNGQ